jgi:hypothetical protein
MVEMSRTYRARAERVGRWWAVAVEADARTIHTQARRLDQVEAMAREATALALAVDPRSFELSIATELPAEEEDLIARARDARERAARAQVESMTVVRDAVRALAAKGLSTRDVGALLGISYQRVAQIRSR